MYWRASCVVTKHQKKMQPDDAIQFAMESELLRALTRAPDACTELYQRSVWHRRSVSRRSRWCAHEGCFRSFMTSLLWTTRHSTKNCVVACALLASRHTAHKARDDACHAPWVQPCWPVDTTNKLQKFKPRYLEIRTLESRTVLCD